MRINYFKDFFKVFVLVFISFITVYYIPFPYNKILFLLILPLAWFTKDDYLFFAYFLVLEDQPGGLFGGGEREEIYRIPIYSLAPGVSFTIRELYLLMLLLKVIQKNHYSKLRIRPFFLYELKLIALLFFVLVLITPVLGASFESYRSIAKIIINLTIFYTIFRIIPDKTSMIKFMVTLLPFTFVALLLQSYGLIFGQQLVGLFRSDIKVTQGILDVSKKGLVVERPIELVHVLLINFISTLYLLGTNITKINKPFLWIVNVLSFVSIMMTATRSWFVAMFFAYILFLLFGQNKPGIIVRYVTISALALVISFSVPLIRNQILSAWERLSTIEYVIKGDITAGGTLMRYDVRAPAVMEAFYDSTVILGSAFSRNHQDHQDYHVGYHNLLLNTGILGALLFFLLILKLLRKTMFASGRNNLIMRMSSVSLVILLLLNAGTQFIGFNVELTPRFFVQAFVLLLIANAEQLSIETQKAPLKLDVSFQRAH